MDIGFALREGIVRDKIAKGIQYRQR